MNKTPELLPSPHDGSKVKFCDECDSGCHRIIGNGIEIDLLPTIRQGDSLENRRAICAERWNARVYPPDVQAAIERDAPKKPVSRPMGWIDFNADHCPNCDTQLHEYTDKNVTFCYSCSQRLDWSE